MNANALEIIIVLSLILLNGLFSLSEMAVVSARKGRLQQKALQGSSGAARALELAENPNSFLSTVQIGITLIGILSGVFGGATLAEEIGAALAIYPWLEPYSEGIGMGIVVLIITYLSLVLGELVPKRLALNNAEAIAARVSTLMHYLSRAAGPLVNLLGASTNFVLRILGARPSDEPEVTEEDIRTMLDQGTETGVLEEVEQDMVERIFRLSDRGVSAMMTPRTDVVFLDVEDGAEDIYQQVLASPFSRYPIIRETPDNVLGIIESRDLFLQRLEGRGLDLEKILKPALFIPESTSALETLERFKQSGAEVGLVIDEFGGILGLVSLKDLLEAIVGEVASPDGVMEAEAVRREDGSWLFDGLIQVDDVKEHLGIEAMPDEEDDLYETLNGMMMSVLGRVPSSGDYFDWDGYRFEVVDMDGHRVDKVLVCRQCPKQ